MVKTKSLESADQIEEIPTLLSIRQFAEKHRFMSENSLRWLLFRDPPGLEACIIRTSRNRLYLDEKKFFAFLSEKSRKMKKDE